jgi:hypothetical protein
MTVWGGPEAVKTRNQRFTHCRFLRARGILDSRRQSEFIHGLTRLEIGFFGAAFAGQVSDSFSLKDKNAIAQFVALYKSWEWSTFDVACEVSANRKAVFLNWLFWYQHDFSNFGINQEQREMLLGHLKQCWEFNHIEVPLPQTTSR